MKITLIAAAFLFPTGYMGFQALEEEINNWRQEQEIAAEKRVERHMETINGR